MTEVFRIIDAASRNGVPSPMNAVVAEDRTMHLPPNCLLVRRDGSEIPIDDAISPIHDREGQVTGAVIVFRDVSAARAMAEEMAHSARARLPDRPARIACCSTTGSARRSRWHHATRTRSRCSSWTSMGSSTSTTHWDTRSATSCCSPSHSAWSGAFAASDTVSRQGGDEFVVLLSEADQWEDAAVRREANARRGGRAPHRSMSRSCTSPPASG